METLQRVLATGVLEALQSRAHVVIAPARNEALCDEVEAIIAPALASITPHLSDVAPKPVRTRESASGSGYTLGHERADEVVEAVVDQIAERLQESDHVDDIFADDHVIRRDAFRTIRDILMVYIRGELEVERVHGGNAFEVPLLELGYVVAAVARQLDVDMLCDALERAAASLGGRVLEVRSASRVACFELPGGAEASRLAIEESITEELVDLIDAELVELPSVEQIIELEQGTCLVQEFQPAVMRAAARTRSSVACAAHCTILDGRTLIATLTPLSDHAVQRTDEAFGYFLEALEEELTVALAQPESGDAPSKRPASGRRKKGAEEAPRSEPRRRGPAATASSTRARQPKKNKKRAK